MILLDTHIWIWWVNGNLNEEHLSLIKKHQKQEIAISRISCWEVAKLVEYRRLEINCTIEKWLQQATAYPFLNVIELDNAIITDSTQLPQPFHRDPADQLIVATARVHDLALFTVDNKILNYPHVRLLR